MLMIQFHENPVTSGICEVMRRDHFCRMFAYCISFQRRSHRDLDIRKQRHVRDSNTFTGFVRRYL